MKFRILLIMFAIAVSACGGAATPPPTGDDHTEAVIKAQLDMNWADLDAGGYLYLYVVNQNRAKVYQLAFETGTMVTRFEAPENSWINGGAHSPDHRQNVIAYAQPPEAGGLQLQKSDLYLLQPDGSLELLLARPTSSDSFTHPTWSPDGAYIYYSHFALQDQEQTGQPFMYTVERYHLESGQTEVLVENAYWPRLSPDGSRLAYLSFDIETLANQLFIANPDGSNPVLLTPEDEVAVAAPVWSPDGEWVWYEGPSAADTPQSDSWLQDWLGVGTALAHGGDRDWQRVSVGGGSPEQMTNLRAGDSYGGFSPGGDLFATINTEGLLLFPVGGGDPVYVLNGLLVGSLEWLP